MRWLFVILGVLLAVLQLKLWVGHGSLAEVHQLSLELSALEAENATLQARNDALHAEVLDLRKGGDAVEERARRELGMVKEGETFYMFVKPDHSPK